MLSVPHNLRVYNVVITDGSDLAVEMTSGGMIYTQNVMTALSGIQVLLRLSPRHLLILLTGGIYESGP
jgi:hypothetical protein